MSTTVTPWGKGWRAAVAASLVASAFSFGPAAVYGAGGDTYYFTGGNVMVTPPLDGCATFEVFGAAGGTSTSGVAGGAGGHIVVRGVRVYRSSPFYVAVGENGS